MVQLSFITPIALALLILLPLFWALALLTPRRIARWRLWSSLLIRTLIFVAVVFALAGAQLVRPVRDLTTIFLVDWSDSVAPAQRERVIAYIDDALAEMPQGDRAGVVVFGENALVEYAPANLTSLSRIRSVPTASRTNLQDAVQLGLALLPSDTQKRLVLISDGGENRGRVADAVRIAAARGVPIDVVPVVSERGPDVIVNAVNAPGTAREGQDLDLNVSVRSTFDTSGRMQVFVDGQLVETQDVTLPTGVNEIPVRVPSGQSGFRRVEVRIDADGDTEPQNNRAAAFTEVLGPPRILIISSNPAGVQNLQAALEAGEVRVDVRGPQQVPADLTQLGDYSGIIIADTPARDLPRALAEILPTYVSELGRGLAMIGGEDSFGAGGYRRTPIEPMLPVSLDPLDTLEQPDLALVMVIDRSGSMSDTSGTDGRTRLDLAKEAVYQASLGLSRQDQIGLVVFDSAADWILPVQTLPSAVDIEQALNRFGPGGGTNIRPGLELARDALQTTNARIKHVILLTDGIADGNYLEVIDEMRAQDVTVSTVAIGRDTDPLLDEAAQRGGGRYKQVESAAEVPQIFLQETVIIAGRDIVEETFTPLIALQSPAIRGLSGLPPLYGYNGTELKASARAFLVTPDGKPVLAQWQYGLGSVVAWTSDLKGQWASDWVNWNEFPRFTGGLLDTLLPPRLADQLSLQATTTGTEAVLDLTAQDTDGRPLNDLALQGRLLDPNGEGANLQFTQVAPGRYRAVTETADSGVYLAQIGATDAEGQPVGAVSTGVVVSYSPEYGETRENPGLLQAVAEDTNGRINPPATAVFEPLDQAVGTVQEIALPLLWLALLLWPLDIALRRLFLRLSDVAPVLARRRTAATPAPAPAAGPMGRLYAAKQRATRVTAAQQEEPHTAVTAPRVPVAKAAPKAPPRPAPQAQPNQMNDEQFARLMAAKRRARSKREG